MRWLRPFIVAAAMALVPSLAFAQLPGAGVQQSGSVTATHCVQWAGNGLVQDAGAGCGSGTGTVTSVSVTTANGVSGSVATPTTTPAISLTLGAITPSSVAIGAGSAITSSGPGGALASGAYAAAGPCTAFGTAAGTCAQGGVITAGGPTGSATVVPIITYNAAGQLTTVSSATITPAVGSITGLGSGVATALGNTAGGSGGFALVSGANVASVSANDTTLTISPTTGAVLAAVNQAANFTWSGTNNFTSTFKIAGNTITWPAAAITVARIDAGQTFNGTQIFTPAGATANQTEISNSTNTTSNSTQATDYIGDAASTVNSGHVRLNNSATANTSLINVPSSFVLQSTGSSSAGLYIGAATGAVTIFAGGTTSGTNNAITISGSTQLVQFNKYTTAGIIVNDASGNLTSSTSLKPGANNHFSYGGSAPAVSACGSGAAIDGNATDSSGTVTVGSVATSCTVTFANAYSTFNHCRVTSQSAISGLAYTYSKSAITVTASVLGGDLFDYSCDGV